MSYDEILELLDKELMRLEETALPIRNGYHVRGMVEMAYILHQITLEDKKSYDEYISKFILADADKLEKERLSEFRQFNRT